MRRWIETDDPGLIPAADPAAQMSTLLSAAMAFVAALILAAALTANRTAGAWEADVDAGLTVELPVETSTERREAVVAALADLPGVRDVRLLSEDEVAGLLEPWLGADTDVPELRLPSLIEVVGEVDAQAAQEAATVVVPQAVVADHASWREPVLQAAARIRVVAFAALGLAALTAGGVVWLAVTASVARSGGTVEVLRLVGATDAFVASRFARPFAVRAAIGSVVGTVAAILALILIRLAGTVAGMAVGPLGYQWLAVLAIPAIVGSLSWIAARLAVARELRSVG